MSSMVRFPYLAALPALLVALGCASSPSTSMPEAMAEPAAIAEPTDDRGTGTIPQEIQVTLKPVYFDTDRAQLRPEAREALAHYARTILAHPEWGVVKIEGHCDERGSEEYNLALGRRRATQVEQYLMDAGVPASRLTSRTFGEEKPAVNGHTEIAWRHNRRSELQVEAIQSANRSPWSRATD